jgi:enoyl-CoA hydratase/carnithine racemase
MDMLLTGGMIDAPTALEIGLVNRVVPTDSVTETAMALAAKIAAKSPYAIRLGKKAVREQAGMGLADAYACASQAIVQNMLDSDAEEGIAAFFQKRDPVWRGE